MTQARLGVSLAVGLLAAAASWGCGGGQDNHIMTPDERLAEEEKKAYEAEQAEKKRRAEEGEVYETEEPAAKEFDEHHAEMELKRATRNAESCTGVVTDSKERGEATVSLVFANDGSVRDARINAPFSDTKLGDCVLNAYKAVLVPPFDGGDHPMSWDLTLSDPPAEAKPKGKK